MDATVTSTLTTSLASFADGITDIIVSVLPAALGLLVLIVGVRFAIRFFRGTAKV